MPKSESTSKYGPGSPIIEGDGVRFRILSVAREDDACVIVVEYEFYGVCSTWKRRTFIWR